MKLFASVLTMAPSGSQSPLFMDTLVPSLVVYSALPLKIMTLAVFDCANTSVEINERKKNRTIKNLLIDGRWK